MSVRTYNPGPRIYLDMDGPLADFDAAAKKHNIHPSKLKLLTGAYMSLPVTEGALHAVGQLLANKKEVFVLTKIPSQNAVAATEKIVWLRNNFPNLGDRIIISPDKGCIGTPADVLVDDHPEWANAHNFPGDIIKFGGVSDEHFIAYPGWDEILPLLLKDY